MPDARSILYTAADDLGWNDDTALGVVLDFIDSYVNVRGMFKQYIDNRVKAEREEFGEEEP